MADPKVQKQIDFLVSAHGTILESARRLKFDSDSLVHVLAIALHATIIELEAACVSMLESGNTIGLPILMRSMYESLVDQTNLLTDTTYAENMEAANLKQMEKLLVQAGDEQNALLKGLSEKWDVPKELEQLRARLAELRKAGHGDLGVFERFKRAGLVAEYRSMYVLLCLDAHGNTSALIERHVDTENGRTQLSIFREPVANSIRARVDAVTAMLLNSAAMIHEAFKSGCDAIKPLQEEHAKIRKELIS